WGGKEIGHQDNTLFPAAPQLADRIWQATFSAGGARRAGLRGDGLMLSRTQPRTADAPDASLSDIQNPIIDAYLDALPAGATPRIVASRSLFVSDDRDSALGFAAIGLERAAEGFRRSGHTLPDGDLAELIRRLDTHVGTAEDVLETLSADTALARATDLTFQVHSIDPPHPEVLRSIELIAGSVAPELGWVNSATVAAH
ncbi:MAG: hypothetical protein JWQ43_1100, partial [Glaciihabitans sp.]|nr:hypothetical protein [Glaciihabitans sp.]